MPSASVMLNVIGAEPGYWIMRIFVRVGGILAHSGTEHNQYCSAELYTLPWTGTSVKPDTKVDSLGRVTFDGAIAGTFSDTEKRGLRVYARYRRGSLLKEVYTDVWLGYLKHDHSGASNWEKWVNLVYKNVDAGIDWYNGLPYTWWWGTSADEFVKALDDHINRTDEPLWNTTAPTLALQFIKCPVCSTVLGLMPLGQDRRCPVCKFVIAWSGVSVKSTWQREAQELYEEKPRLTLGQNFMMFR